jgi:hypothetical protein
LTLRSIKGCWQNEKKAGDSKEKEKVNEENSSKKKKKAKILRQESSGRNQEEERQLMTQEAEQKKRLKEESYHKVEFFKEKRIRNIGSFHGPFECRSLFLASFIEIVSLMCLRIRNSQ